MKKIVNLTQHYATSEQAKAGVIDLDESWRKVLQDLLTFDELPDITVLIGAAEGIAALPEYTVPDADRAMIGGAPFLMFALESALIHRGIKPLYAFSKRESVEETQSDGSVKKVAVFRHVGFVETING